jgi:hypothetical protein
MKFHSTLPKLCGTLVGYTCARWSAYQMGNGQMIDCSGNLCTQRKTCPSATLSTTNPTWTGLGLNLGLYGGKLVAEHQSCDLYLGILGWLYDTNFFTVSTTTNNMNLLAQHVSILIKHSQVPYLHIKHFTLK